MNILLKKFNLDEIREKGFNYVDIHCHSTSSDGCNHANDIIDYANKLGIGISIADHNQIKGSVIACKSKKVFSIPAIEVTSKNTKDILLYFYNVKDLIEYFNKYVKGSWRHNRGFNMNRTTLVEEDIIDHAKDYNCLIILAHPFTNRPKRSYEMFNENQNLLKKVNGIEIINSSQSLLKNKRAIDWHYRLKRNFTAGSDMHHISELGASLTIGKSEKVEGFLEDIRKKKNKAIGYSIEGLKKVMFNIRLVHNNWRFSK